MCRFSLIVRCAGCAIVAWACACGSRDEPAATPVARMWESGPSPPAGQAAPVSEPVQTMQPVLPTQPADVGTERATPAKVIAVVNGRPIDRAELIEMLIEGHGLRALEQLVLLTAARQRAAEMSLTVTEADVQAAHEDALRKLGTPVSDPDGPVLDREAAQRLLDQFLAAKNISRPEWNCRMQQRAYLGKIAEAEVKQVDVTDKMLEKEYDLAHGEKVQVRHIQVSSLAAAGRVRSLLANKGFELVARQMSENEFTSANGGLIRPFTRDDPGVTPLLRKAAFDLKLGAVSDNIREGSIYHIIRLERRFPASDVGFENVDRDRLRRRLLKRLIEQRQQRLEAELFQEATVDIRNGALSRQFHDKHRRSNR